MTKNTNEPKNKTNALLIACVVFCFLTIICSNIFACPCSPTCSTSDTWYQICSCYVLDGHCTGANWYILGRHIIGTCCTGFCNIIRYETKITEIGYLCSGDSPNCTVPSEPDWVTEGSVPVVDCVCCPTPCNPANCEECVDCSCQPCGGNPDKTCCHGRRCCSPGENCCDDGHCCPSGQTCCGGSCCDSTKCCDFFGHCYDCCKVHTTGDCEAHNSDCGCDILGPWWDCSDNRKTWTLGSTQFCYSDCLDQYPCNPSLIQVDCYAWQACKTGTTHWDSWCAEGTMRCEKDIGTGYCQDCITDGDSHVEKADSCKCP